MPVRVVELELPLGDGPASELALRRFDHLRQVSGVDGSVLLRLSRAFPSLAAIYTASETELARVVGPVPAARIRWFLDAPLATNIDPVPPPVVARAA
jgi:ERCC4-type nuclease